MPHSRFLNVGATHASPLSDNIFNFSTEDRQQLNKNGDLWLSSAHVRLRAGFTLWKPARSKRKILV